MLSGLKRLIPLRWKHSILQALSSRRPPAGFPTGSPRLIVALAADYPNLGDVALTRALVELCRTHLPAHIPYLLPASRVFQDLRGVARAARPEDIVLIVGGGNMGDLYPDLEDARVRVVESFPSNLIISFPQSVDFSDTPAGRRMLARSRKAYESHPRLEIFARDEESFSRMRSYFPGAKVALAPDTVFAMSVSPSLDRGAQVLVCMRQDREADLDATGRRELLVALAASHPALIITDTIVPGPRLSYPEYDRRLGEFLESVSQSRCVVTDRLHGLIFSVITGTPCVVIENNNHKIRALVRTWLRDHPGIRMLSRPTATQVAAAIAEIQDKRGSAPDLSEGFASLISTLKAASKDDAPAPASP